MSRGPTPRPGRNDPCHCGSGRKYKNCHLHVDEQEDPVRTIARRFLDLNERLVMELVMFAEKRFGDTWRCFEDDFKDPVQSAQLSLPWALHQMEIEGGTVLDHYVAMKRAYLSDPERAWHAAQQASWLSVWEVTALEPGKSVALRDLLTGQARNVSETTASRTLVLRDTVLARVVDVEGISLFNGLHPRGLPPQEASEVVRLVRAGLPGRGKVKPAQLHNDTIARVMIAYWEQAYAAIEARPSLPQALRNTDGDPFLLTTDHFDIAPGTRVAVEARLATIPGAEPPEPDDDPPAYVFVRVGSDPKGNVIVGQATVAGNVLCVETNSIKRADAMRARIEDACGERIRHRLREHMDPLSKKAPSVPRKSSPEPMNGEAVQVLHHMMRQHYTEWLDSPIPALKGKTPREAVRTRQGRKDVDLLLREFENREQRRPNAPPFDFAWLRRELGLDDG